MIPEAAVTAAAKVTFEGLFDLDPDDGWEYLTPTEREPYEHQARAALEAAAPHMLAEAWDEGSIAGWVESGLPHSWHAENSLRNSNPYRTAK